MLPVHTGNRSRARGGGLALGRVLSQALRQLRVRVYRRVAAPRPAALLALGAACVLVLRLRAARAHVAAGVPPLLSPDPTLATGP